MTESFDRTRFREFVDTIRRRHLLSISFNHDSIVLTLKLYGEVNGFESGYYRLSFDVNFGTTTLIREEDDETTVLFGEEPVP